MPIRRVSNSILSFVQLDASRMAQDGLEVRIEQLRTRIENYPLLILAQVVLQPLFVWLLWERVPQGELLLWLACFYGLHTVEAINWSMHKSELETPQHCRFWDMHFLFFALAAGLMWGAAAWFFFPDDVAFQSLMICILLGLAAGAVTMNPIHPPSLYAYVFGVMLPLIVRVALVADSAHRILALMMGVFMVLALLAGRQLNRTFMLSLRQRFDNFSLLQQITERKVEAEAAKKKLEQANKELQENESKLERMVEERTAELLRRTREIEQIKDATIIALSSLAETRDNETGNHIRRTQNYVHKLAVRLKDHPRFNHFLTDENIHMLYKIAPLHDVGKVGIPDHILHKPGRLTQDEFEVMKRHTVLGGNAIATAIEEGTDHHSPFLNMACQIALRHHEKWDGSGYPSGLRGDDIPIAARLMALADVYDALSCRRVYKPAMPSHEVEAIIVDGRGTHFDPDVVDAFLDVQHEFVAIAERYSD